MHKARPPIVVLVAALLVSCDGNAAPTGQNASDSADPSSTLPASQIWFPEPDQDVGALNGIRALAPEDVWVVGETKVEVVNGRGNAAKALIAHWNGTQWTTLATFGDGVNDYVLNDIAVISGNDVWAVGKHTHPQGTTVIYEPLAVHWNGGTWSVMPMPAEPAGISELKSVVALAPDNVWAAGRELIHWNGIEWKIEDVQAGKMRYPYLDVSALSANDVWVAAADTLLHWDGAHWNKSYSTEGQATPYPYAPLLFHKILAVGPNDVWALGSVNIPTNSGGLYGFTFHWDGISWQKQTGSGQRSYFGFVGGGSYIEDIYATTAHQVWGIGGPNLLQWDGTEWTQFGCPAEGSDLTHYYAPEHYYWFTGMAEVAKDELWVTGHDVIPHDSTTPLYNNWYTRGWVLHPYLGPCPTPTPVPTERPIPTAPPPQPGVPGEIPTRVVWGPPPVGTSRVPDAVVTYPAPPVP